MSLGSIVVRLSMATADFDTDSKRAAKIAEKRAKEIDDAFRKAGTAIGAALGAGVVAAVAGLTAVTKKAIDFGEQIAEISNKTGVGAETLSGWAYAADQSGASLEDLSGALPKLAKNLAGAQEEGSRLALLFESLDIATVDAEGNLRSVEEVLPEIADRFKGLNNETLEASLAMEVFGRSGAGLLEFLNNGSSGLNDFADRARDLGIVLSDEAAARADEFKDGLGDLEAVALALGVQLAEKLLPALNNLVDDFVDLVQEGEAAAEIAGRIETAFDALGTTLTVVDGTIQGVTFDTIALFNALDGLMRLTPPGWLMSWMDGGSASASFNAAGVARDMAAEQSARVAGAFGDDPASSIRWIDPPASGSGPDPRDSEIAALEDRLSRFLANPTGKTGAAPRAEKSEAEKAAERLQKSYESLVESLERQQFMLGQTGEAAQVRYETELGSLRELDPLLKQELLTKALLLDAEVAAREEAEKQAELDERATEAFEEMNRSILDQIELIGMSADEQEIWNNLAWAGVDAESARGQEIIENTRLMQELRDQMDDQIGAMDAVRDAGAGLIEDFASGVEPIEALEDAWDSLHKKLLAMISENLIERLLGKLGDPGGGAGGDWLGNLFGSLFGSIGGGGGGGGSVVSGILSAAGNIKGGDGFSKSAAFPFAPVSKSAGAGTRAATVVQNFNMPGRYDLRTQAQISADAGRSTQRALARGTA